MYIYADNAATTAMSAAAKEKVREAEEKYWANPSSLHRLGQEAKEQLELARKSIADHLGAQPTEIYFTSGGSEADNQAILSAARAGEKKGKKHLISSRIEHHAVLHTLDRLKKEGFEVTLLDVDRDGILDPETVRRAIRPDTALVTVMYANNETGTIEPIAEIGAICREADVTFHTDAVQAGGHIPIDVRKDNIDMLSLAAHKFEGPKGVGVLFVRRGMPIFSLIEGGSQERARRAGTENLPAILGMAAAWEEAHRTMEENAAYTAKLRDKLIVGFETIPHSVLNGKGAPRLPGTVNFCFEGIEGESLLLWLDERGIAASSGSACTSGDLDPSHVLLALGLPHDVAHGSLRLSVNHHNTEAEIDHIIEAVRDTVAYLRGISPMWEAMENGTRPHIL